MNKLLWPVFLSVLSCNAAAQEGSGRGAGGGPPRLSVGIAAILSDSPYAGEGARVIPIPLITYQGENFYFRGVTAGWNVVRNESFELSAITKFRFDGFSVNDLGREELASNGIDYRLLEDRDLALDAGVGMKWKGEAGEIELELLADVTDTSGGQEASVQYGYPVRLGNGMMTLNLGATWISEDNANYYYGTLDEEVARGVINYRPDAATIAHVGFSYFRPLGNKWSLMALVKYSMLPDEISNSPFIEPDTDSTVSALIGISRGF
ncbi:MipA/OmpV family protein [Teredinibacter haidensis]|uniref:MipA/OmpV family protein n=1 Tax=Teredinibacter haidensis TaxID=2731755 RepID=UPI000B26488A|nr:MipA/OmpV family protein [Teredinibacter haidensis]